MSDVYPVWKARVVINSGQCVHVEMITGLRGEQMTAVDGSRIIYRIHSMPSPKEALLVGTEVWVEFNSVRDRLEVLSIA